MTGQFEKHTKGVGRRVMEKLGWKEGEGLKNGRKEGIKEALEGSGRPYGDRTGIGYVRM